MNTRMLGLLGMALMVGTATLTGCASASEDETESGSGAIAQRYLLEGAIVGANCDNSNLPWWNSLKASVDGKDSLESTIEARCVDAQSMTGAWRSTVGKSYGSAVSFKLWIAAADWPVKHLSFYRYNQSCTADLGRYRGVLTDLGGFENVTMATRCDANSNIHFELIEPLKAPAGSSSGSYGK